MLINNVVADIYIVVIDDGSPPEKTGAAAQTYVEIPLRALPKHTHCKGRQGYENVKATRLRKIVACRTSHRHTKQEKRLVI